MAQDSQSRSLDSNFCPDSSYSQVTVRPSPGAGVYTRRNSSVAESMRPGRSARSRARSAGCSLSHSRECAVRAVVVSNPPPMSSTIASRMSSSLAGSPANRGFDQGVHHAGTGVGPDIGDAFGHTGTGCQGSCDDPWQIRRVRRRVQERMSRLAIDHPVRERQAHERQGHHSGDHIGQVVDEIDPAGLDPSSRQAGVRSSVIGFQRATAAGDRYGSRARL